MKRRLFLVAAALVLLIALSIFPWAGQTTAYADEGCSVYGAASADAGQTGDLGTLVSGVAASEPELAATIILGELAGWGCE